MSLRPYQQEAVDAVIEHVRKSVDPCLVEAATGAGKSHIIAAVAEILHKMSGGKHVLCLAPNAELVDQNREKFLKTGSPASVFSASAGSKCLRHPVVFATPLSVKNSISRFGSKFCAVIIDEAHELTPSIKFIIEKIKDLNPKLRVIGLSATPYRLGEGFIYSIDENDNPCPDDSVKEPYFTKKVYSILAKELIAQGFLTPPLIGDINSHVYDVSQLSPTMTDKQKDQALLGQGRKTAAIVADIVAQSQNRKGVMLFAQTIRHAEEIMASLPKHLSAIVTEKTKVKDRRAIRAAFLDQRIKYLVNVACFTKGFDAPHVDVIAVLRLTESIALLQQIFGRGMRLYEGKKDFLILDYAGNIENHCPEGDIFAPIVKAHKKGEQGGYISSACPGCGTVNQFNARPNKDGLEYDEEGYFVDLLGNRIMTDNGPIPGHYGRRCRGMSLVKGEFIQCSHRWTFKPCPECNEENDIAAKYCSACKCEIIDPNEKLIGDFKRYKKDATNIQTDKVLSQNNIKTVTKKGEECLRVDYTTEYRKFSIWYFPEATKGLRKVEYTQFLLATDNLTKPVDTVTYKKDSVSGFYRVFNYNDKADSSS